MADRSVPYKILNSLLGGFIANADQVELLQTYVGLLNGVNNAETALRRLDGTGVGAAIFRFTGAYSAQASNIAEWFGGKQLIRLRCIDSGTGPSVSGAVRFDLPGTTALNTAFDQLVAAGLPEQITFIIEYTGASDDFLSIFPRVSPSPQIAGATNIVVRSGVAATIEITRSSGVLSDYIFQAIGGIGNGGNVSADSIKLINPQNAVWDASANGPLPTTGVVKGNAYPIVNAPSDGSGRFGEVMQNGDFAIWFGEAFSSWASEPHQWFVLPAHDVRRITALEQQFLTGIEVTPESNRNTIIRGANYADSAGEIRLKIYPQRADYDAADLNTTGDIDEYTDPADQSGYLAIRFAGTLSSLVSVLPTLYVFSEDSGTFTRLLNLERDFSHQGDFGAESDYLSNDTINYGANTVLRVYIGQPIDRYNNPSLDIFESSLVTAVQQKLNRADGNSSVDAARLASLESKVAALFPLTPDVARLVEWGEIFVPDNPTQRVVEQLGYTLIADYRGDGDRYESAGVAYDNSGTNVVTYSGLTENLHRAFGFRVSGPSDQILMWLVDGATRIPFIDITAAGRFRINNYREAITAGDHVTGQLHFLTRTSGDEIVTTAADSKSTFTITPFPTGATETSRGLQINTDVFVNGVDTLAGHLMEIDLPADNTAQARAEEVVHVNLGPLHGNRTVTITIGYELRVSGADLFIDLTLISAPPDISIRFTDVATTLNYTAPDTTTRVDDFEAFTDSLGIFTFSGNTNLILAFQPHPIENSINAVPAAIDSSGAVTLLNDIAVPIPAHDFASVEIPDTLEFRTLLPDHFLRHSDLDHLLRRASTKWCYGLALLEDVTEHRISQELEFDSFILVGSTNGTRVRVTMDDSNLMDIKFQLTQLP